MAQRNRDSVLLRFISLAVPFAFGVLYWVRRFKADGVLQLPIGSADSLASEILTAVLTCVLVSLVSKGIGYALVSYFDSRQN